MKLRFQGNPRQEQDGRFFRWHHVTPEGYKTIIQKRFKKKILIYKIQYRIMNTHNIHMLHKESKVRLPFYCGNKIDFGIVCVCVPVAKLNGKQIPRHTHTHRQYTYHIKYAHCVQISDRFLYESVALVFPTVIAF